MSNEDRWVWEHKCSAQNGKRWATFLDKCSVCGLERPKELRSQCSESGVHIIKFVKPLVGSHYDIYKCTVCGLEFSHRYHDS